MTNDEYVPATGIKNDVIFARNQLLLSFDPDKSVSFRLLPGLRGAGLAEGWAAI